MNIEEEIQIEDPNTYHGQRQMIQNRNINFFSFLQNNEAAIHFLIEHELIDIPACSACGAPTILSNFPGVMDKFSFRCPRKVCRNRMSVRRQFWDFAKIRIGEMVYLFFECFLQEYTIKKISRITGLHKSTVMKAKRHFWRLLTEYYFHPHLFGQIGEEGAIVEYDESKFKRKYNLGRITRRGWVFGALERGRNGKKILISIPNRNAATLEAVIREWVSLDSIMVITDEWRGYRGLNRRMGFAHHTVNHSTNFAGAYSRNRGLLEFSQETL